MITVADLVKKGEENRLDKGLSIVAYTLAVLLGLFQIYTAFFGVLPAVYQRAAHWGIIGNFIFCYLCVSRKGVVSLEY